MLSDRFLGQLSLRLDLCGICIDASELHRPRSRDTKKHRQPALPVPLPSRGEASISSDSFRAGKAAGLLHPRMERAAIGPVVMASHKTPEPNQP